MEAGAAHADGVRCSANAPRLRPPSLFRCAEHTIDVIRHGGRRSAGTTPVTRCPRHAPRMSKPARAQSVWIHRPRPPVTQALVTCPAHCQRVLAASRNCVAPVGRSGPTTSSTCALTMTVVLVQQVQSCCASPARCAHGCWPPIEGRILSGCFGAIARTALGPRTKPLSR